MADRRWASTGKRQIIVGVIGQLKDFFCLECHRAKTLGGLLTRLAAKVAADRCATWRTCSYGSLHISRLRGRRITQMSDVRHFLSERLRTPSKRGSQNLPSTSFGE